MITVLTILLRLLLGGAASVAVAVVLMPAPASAAERTSLRIEVYGLLGLHVLTLHSIVEESGDQYAITTDYATSSIAGLLVRLSTRATVRGRLLPRWAQPISYHRDTLRNGEARHESVEYRPDGTVIGRSTPPSPRPLPVASARGTVDNLTAYFLLERQLARTGNCTLRVPVYDGRYRYDLYFSDAGRRKLAQSGGQDFAGEAIGCKMRRHDLIHLDEPEQKEGASQGTIWYAKLVPGDDVMIPVRMQMQAQIGTVDGYLAELHGRGVNLKLME